MNVALVLEGIGLCVLAVAVLVASRWFAADDGRMRRLAESRWWFDRRVQAELRHGNLGRDEWFERFIRHERAIIRWVLTPVMILWAGLCVVIVVTGLAGR